MALGTGDLGYRGHAPPEPPAARRFLVGLCVSWLAGLLATQLQLPVLVSSWHSYATWSLAVALLGALLYLTRLRPLVVAATAGLVVLWLAVGYTPLAGRLVRSTVRADPVPAQADAIFVFSSSLQADGEPTATAMARLERGLELLGQRKAPRLVLSELPPPNAQYLPWARALMDHLGLSGELLAVGPVLNTRDEGVRVGELFRRNGWKQVIAVSSPSHTRRAAAVLEGQGLTVAAVPAAETRYDLEGVPHPEDRFLAFGAALHDLVGYQVYRLRGYLGRPR